MGVYALRRWVGRFARDDNLGAVSGHSLHAQALRWHEEEMPQSLSPLLLLPGLLCDAALWRAQVEQLSDIAAVSVPDLTLDDSVEDMAERILSVAPHRFSLAALSMGGYVAFEILRRAPERVERLALISTSASPDTPERAQERKDGLNSLRLGRFVGVTQRLLPQLIHPDRISDPVSLTVQAMAERVGGEAYLRQQRAILNRPDSRPLLSMIDVATVIVVGEQDVLTPVSESVMMQKAIKGSALHVFRQCGHLPPLEQPTETGALLRNWLRS